MELLLAPLVSFGAVALLVLTVLGRENHELGDRLGPYMTSRPEEQQRQLSQSFLRRVLMPTFLRAPNMAGVVLRGTSRGKLQLLLESAGSPLRLEVFLAIQIAGAATLPLGYLALTLSRGAGLEPIQLLLALALAGLGAYVPRIWLGRRQEARQKAIQRALPDALDLIVVSMEAGLALDAALAKVVEKTKGPLSQELQRMLREMQLGKPRREAMRELGLRTGVKDLIAVVNAIAQADQMGVSMTELMRTQAAEARTRRRQRAEEKAHQAAVKMIIPLITCILPSIFIVTGGQAGISIWRAFSHGGLGS
ncbi:MAG TPA: type II secretion system F family protein [Chloroflexota bacterium]|jgi:tight adherence protein C